MMADDGDDTGQEPEVDVIEAVESGNISILNSLVGHGSPRSLQLWGTIGSGKVHVLIDNGSTHNFVRPDVVERMCLPGANVVLFGIQWLQKLGKGDASLRMKKISLRHMQALLESEEVYGVYEFHNLPIEADVPATTAVTTESEHPELNQLLARFDSLF
ncbi:hypothetical protein Tco_0598059 [Tanacetum coccineum]